MTDITNVDDIIDSRDILEYIEKYKDDKDFEEEVKALQSIVEEYCDNYTYDQQYDYDSVNFSGIDYWFYNH